MSKISKVNLELSGEQLEEMKFKFRQNEEDKIQYYRQLMRNQCSKELQFHSLENMKNTLKAGMILLQYCSKGNNIYYTITKITKNLIHVQIIKRQPIWIEKIENDDSIAYQTELTDFDNRIFCKYETWNTDSKNTYKYKYKNLYACLESYKFYNNSIVYNTVPNDWCDVIIDD
jgi:hypothetical protein